MRSGIRVLPAVERALTGGKPVVALESSVLAQGLPTPQNRDAATRMIAAVERCGAVAAITAVARGTPTVGLEPAELERFLRRDGVRKVSARDVAWSMVHGADGATTVAASLMLAHAVGIQVFATGGIGGVHHEPAFDESADLLELSKTPMIVVSSGAKSILDLRATWERLETLGVSVVGYGTRELPGFYTAETGIALDAWTNDARDIVGLHRAQRALGRSQAVLVVQPPPARFALDRRELESAVRHARAAAVRDGVHGAAVTPYLLEAITRSTGGTSLDANLALLEQNAALAGEIARAVAEAEPPK